MLTIGGTFILAQVVSHTVAWKPVLMWIGVGIGCLVLGGSLLLMIRKKMLEDEAGINVAGSLMEQLREARRRGEITEAEYDQARRSMASRVSQVLDTKRADGLFELPDPKRRPPRPRIVPHSDAATPDHEAGPSRQAPPGYDLTGEPLPKPEDGE